MYISVLHNRIVIITVDYHFFIIDICIRRQELYIDDYYEAAYTNLLPDEDPKKTPFLDLLMTTHFEDKAM